MNKQQQIRLTIQQAQAIMHMMGMTGPVTVTEVTRHNHVWRLDSEQNSYFLKIFTKEWYSSDTDGYPIEHEQGAYECLRVHQLPSARVSLARSGVENPLQRPFLVTEKAPGQLLMTLLENAADENRNALLSATGDYLRRIHDITFSYPGYVDSPNGPSAALDENGYVHESWSAKQLQRNALAQLQREELLLSATLVDTLRHEYARIVAQLSHLYQPPCFVITNAQIDHIFLVEAQGMWQVSGCIDMEAASAGNSMYDLVYLATQIATVCQNDTYWWQSLFNTYGVEPDFELFQLQMLASSEHNFRFGNGWTGTRGEILERILSATTWYDLFAARLTPA